MAVEAFGTTEGNVTPVRTVPLSSPFLFTCLRALPHPSVFSFLILFSFCRRADIVETPLAIFNAQQWRIPLSCDLVRLVILCRTDAKLVDELARFCVEVLSCRQRAFKKLTVRDVFPD